MTVVRAPLEIARCGVSHYSFPREAWWPQALVDKTLSIDAIDIVTCEVETREGVTGFGYTYTLGHGGAAVRALLEHDVAPRLVGLKFAHPQAFWSDMWRSLARVGRGGVLSVALAAADIALWDALSRAAGLPLYAYLGGTRTGIRAYGSAIDLGYTTDELVASVSGYRERGFDAVKVKVGRAVEEDVERVEAVRRAVGPACELMVDANMGWRLPEAMRRARSLEQFDLTWLEEPLSPDDLDGHVRLQASTVIPIAAGETLFSLYEFDRYIRAGALAFVQADVGRLGGITPWLHVAHLAEAAGLPMAPHFMQDVHVHLLCAIPNGSFLECLPLLDALLERPLRLEAGRALPPDEPGIGVSFRHDLLAGHAVGPAP